MYNHHLSMVLLYLANKIGLLQSLLSTIFSTDVVSRNSIDTYSLDSDRLSSVAADDSR